jgi:hypothetical protein
MGRLIIWINPCVSICDNVHYRICLAARNRKDELVGDAWIGPAVIASLITATVSAVAAILAARTTASVAKKRAIVDERLKNLEGEIAEQKIRLEQRTLFQAERAAYELLSDHRWPTRSFEQIRQHIGGFSDEELRQILVRAGALRVQPPTDISDSSIGNSKSEAEFWGLLERINLEADPARRRG